MVVHNSEDKSLEIVVLHLKSISLKHPVLNKYRVPDYEAELTNSTIFPNNRVTQFHPEPQTVSQARLKARLDSKTG